MTLDLTRRSLLAAMPVAAAATALPTLAGASPPDSGLEQAIAAYERIQAESDRFHANTHDPAYEAYQARSAAIPHVRTTHQFVMAGTGQVVQPSTSDKSTVRMARSIIADIPATRRSDLIDTCRELVKLADDRDAQEGRIAKELDIEKLARRSDSYSEKKCAALCAVEDYPVATLPAMLRKIEVLTKGWGGDPDIWGEWTLADLRRIAGEA